MSGSWEASCDRSSFPEGLSPEAFRSGERSLPSPLTSEANSRKRSALISRLA